MLSRSFFNANPQSLFQKINNVLGINVQTAGLRNFPVPEKIKFEYPPEKKRLAVLPKTPNYNNIKPFKMQKKLRLMRGPELILNKLQHRQYGIIALCGGRLKHGHFEMIRTTCTRKLPKTAAALWRVDAPWQPVTKKTQGTRMGGGKGEINAYVTPIKERRVIIEVVGPFPYSRVKHVLEEIAHILPFKAMAVSQEILDKMDEQEKYIEENNENYWTMKYIIQNNFGGCHRWIKPIDKYYFCKYT